jgi:hypothetical protein
LKPQLSIEIKGSIVMSKEARLSSAYINGQFPQVLAEFGLRMTEGNSSSLIEDCSDAKL